MDKLYTNVEYFTSLISFLSSYSGSNIIIDDGYNLTYITNININNSFINLNLDKIPVTITLENSLLIVNENTQINGINFKNNNTLVLQNGTLIEILEANLSGNLTLITNQTEGNVTIMKYGNRTGTFENLDVKGIDNCTSAQPIYSETQLTVAFSVKQDCPKKEIDDYLIYIIIGVIGFVVILIIIAVIIIFKVQWVRKRIFPHRDKTYYNRRVNSDYLQKST